MNAKHTKGPWYVGGHPRDDSGTAWREVLTDALEFSPSYICQALPNDARLIASAPDLLAACVAIRDALNAYAGDHGEGGRGWPAVGVAANAIERAIRQATGADEKT